MGRKLNIKNRKFGNLYVLNEEGKSIRGVYLWKCKCDCGKIIIVGGSSLTCGNTKSCGCSRNNHIKNLTYNHGFCGTHFYKIWADMKQRCGIKTRKDFKWYGGRGITYDPKWKNFLGFYEDMYFKYRYAQINKGIKNPSIERENVNGNYNKENCIFIDVHNQGKNTRTLKYFKAISPEGKIYYSNHQTDFALKNNLSKKCISQCLNKRHNYHKGWKFNFLNNI